MSQTPARLAVEEVTAQLGRLPYMTPKQALLLADFFTENDIRHCLELGTYHGKSAAYIAAILRANGGGTLATVDQLSALQLSPTVHETLQGVGLADAVTVHIEPRSLTWRLMRMLEDEREPWLDFCYFDGGHSWDVTGFAFLLVDRMLKPGGWVLFDDLDWLYESMVKPGEAMPDWLAKYPPEERVTPQVRKAWELLVKRSPHYSEFREDGAWGFAQKRPTSPP